MKTALLNQLSHAFFCKGDYFSDKCDKYKSLKRLAQQKHYFVSSKAGHMCKNCPRSQLKSCHYCGNGSAHNVSICPQKLGESDVSLIVPECGKQLETSGQEIVKPSGGNNSTVSENDKP